MTHQRLYILSILLAAMLLGANGACFAKTHEADKVSQYQIFEVTFRYEVEPEAAFDSSQVRIDAEIVKPGGERIFCPCFFDGEDRWKLRFTPSKVGEYKYRILLRSDEDRVLEEGTFQVVPSEDPGFLRVGQNTGRHFVYENGESYFPLGENLGWVNGATLEPWISYLDECHAAGINWIRIWMCPWGLTELEWMPTHGRYHGLGRYDLRNARMIDGIFREAQKREIQIQWVINHHGQYSTHANPIWDSNPYNVENDGFLEDPEDFFCHPRMKEHYRDRLRYLVARWGGYTNLLAWEFWNEVNITKRDYHFSLVKEWHEEMSGYLRQLDPYDHLQTTSGAGDSTDLHTIDGLDFIQTHAYVENIIDKIMDRSQYAYREYPRTPHFFGEMSYDADGPNREDKEGVILHNQLWASAHSWDSGTAMTWWWDNWVRPYDLYGHFQILSDYLSGIDWEQENLLPMKCEVEEKEENRGDLIFIPPKGWSRSEVEEFSIKPDGTVDPLEELTQFVHGQAHRERAPNPVFLVNLDKPKRFGLKIEEVSTGGAVCEIQVDGESQIRKGFASADNHSTIGEEGYLSLMIPAGEHRVSVKNRGNDWFRVNHFWLEDYQQRVVVYARGNEDRVLAWVHDRPHQFTFLQHYDKYSAIIPTEVRFPALTDGEYLLEYYDTYEGTRSQEESVVTGEEGLRVPIPSFEKDMALQIRKNTAGVSDAVEKNNKNRN